MRRLACFFGLGLLACSPKTLVSEEARPAVIVSSPLDQAEVPYGTAFTLEALALAPPGARLLRLELVASGAWSERRSVPLSGEGERNTLEFTIPDEDRLGADGQKVELRLTAEAELKGRTLVSDPEVLTVILVDQRAPELTVRPPEGSQRIEGFDWALPSGRPFRVELTAKDPSGGVAKLGLVAPATLGGPREEFRAPASVATRTFTIDPPLNGDFELSVYAEDAAGRPNRTTRVIKLRIGEGGAEPGPPSVQIEAPSTVECAFPTSIAATASDPGSGLERLSLTTPAGTDTIFGPDPDHPETLRLEGQLLVLAVGPGELTAAARNLAQGSASQQASFTVVDTTPPSATLPPQALPTAEAGAPWSVSLDAEERCGQLAQATLALSDGRQRITATATLSGARQSGPLAFLLPRGLCTLTPWEGGLVVLDQGGLASATVALSLDAQDRIGPQIGINTLVAGTGLEPGESLRADVTLLDPETGVASATVTVNASGLVGVGLLDREVRAAPPASCGGLPEASIGLDRLLPPDLRFSAPEGRLRLEVEAQDHAGNRQSSVTEIRVVDRAPPELQFAGDGPIVRAGDTPTLQLALRERHHQLDSVALTISGPATFGGPTTLTFPLSGTTATVSIPLQVDANAALDLPIRIEASATDTALVPNLGRATWTLSTCGTPRVASVAPPVGPSLGGQRITVTGSGFLPGATQLSLGSVPLEDLVIESATVASGRVPGPQTPASVDLVVENQCGTGSATARVVAAHRYAAPPVLTRVRPGVGGTATPGEALLALVSAEADRVPLTRLTVTVGTGAPVELAGLGRESLGALAETLLTPAASGAVALSAEAVDSLGQASLLNDTIPIGPPAPVALAVPLPDRPLALGETIGLTLLMTGSDGARRDQSDLGSFTVSPGGVLTVLPGPRLQATAVGTATLTATLGGLSSSWSLEVQDNVLVIPGPPLYLSSLAASGTVGATIQVLHLVGGAAVEVTDLASLALSPTSIATLNGHQLRGQTPGDGRLSAALFGLNAELTVRVRAQLDVLAGEDWRVPDRQVFSGGSVAGRVRTDRGSPSGFTLTIAGPRFELLPGGVLSCAGAGPWALGAGGPGGPGGGGGGAAAYPGGAPGGLGDPAGQSTLDNLAATLGGAGGGVFGSEGRGARAQASSAGAGGGGDGPGGRGGDTVVASMVLGGLGRLGVDSQGGGGGGGGRGTSGGGSGGGGGGGRFVLDAAGAELILDGQVEVQGGPGAARASPSTPGGGGGGGAFLAAAQRLSGHGQVLASGGPGGGPGPTGNRGSGGGGGGGSVRFVLEDDRSGTLNLDVSGGRCRPGAGTAQAGEPGATGRVSR